MKLRPATHEDEGRVEAAIHTLQMALALLTHAGCVKTAARVRLALSSAKGAQRHVHTRAFHTTKETK